MSGGSDARRLLTCLVLIINISFLSPIIGYVILIAGLLALSSVGAALDLQRGGVSPEMKILWRLSSTTILFFFFAFPKFKWEELKRFTLWQLVLELPIAGMAYASMNAMFASSLELTSLVNAFSKYSKMQYIPFGGCYRIYNSTTFPLATIYKQSYRTWHL